MSEKISFQALWYRGETRFKSGVCSWPEARSEAIQGGEYFIVQGGGAEAHRPGARVG